MSVDMIFFIYTYLKLLCHALVCNTCGNITEASSHNLVQFLPRLYKSGATWWTPLEYYKSGDTRWTAEQMYTHINVFVGVIIISTIKHVTNYTVASFATMLLKFRQNGVISKKLNITKHPLGPDYAYKCSAPCMRN